MAFLQSIQPLKRRLPLLISLLLGIAVGVFAWAAYRQMVQVLREAANQRATHAVGQLSSALEQSARRLKTESRRVAADSGVQALLLQPNAARRERVQRLFTTILGQATTQIEGMAVLDSSGARVVTAGEVGEEAPPIAVLEMDWDTTTESTRIEPIELDVEPPRYRVITRIEDRGRTLGYFVQHRMLSTEQGFALIEGLIGQSATLLLGNASGNGWTDVQAKVPASAVQTDEDGGVRYVDAQGETLLGAVASVRETPWRAMVAEAESHVLAPARNHLRAVIPFAVLVVAAGALGSWLLSRSITRPLAEIGAAADAVAKGDLTHRVSINRTDELGRLATSFNSMAEQIAGATHDLETRVEQRTEELREAQSALVRRERLATLGQLAGSVGHELRNPLGVMTNAVFYLEATLPGQSGPVQEYLDILKNQIGLSEKIISDLLDYARIKPPQRDFVHLDQLVEEQRRRLPPVEGIEVVTEFGADLPPAYVDQVQIGQVLLNLLSNAIQAMPNGGTLDIRGAKNGADWVVLEVRDSGCGIAPENQEKVFEPLFTTKARGIGLGLAVSRGLAQANDGSLTLVSKIGRGSTFSLKLPTRPEVVA